MRDWLIINGKAGDGKRGESFWKAHLNAVGMTDFTTRDLTQPTWDSDICEGDRVLVAGGDGSVNRVASLCVERKATLAVLPSGTANDFSRNLGLPEDPAELCRLVASGQTADVDVAWIDDRLFLNVAHIGLGTVPSREASQGHKRRWGRFSYLFTLAQRVGLQKGIHARIECNDQVAEGRWLTIAIASGAYFGGGHYIAEARIDDGYLDVVAVRQRPWLPLLVAFITTRLLRRTPRRNDTVVHFKAPECQVKLRHAHTLTADGEDMGRMADVVAFTRRGVLKVLCEQLAPPQPLMLREKRFTPSDTHPMAWSSSGPF
ncbi:YegS/Rv2252/BmrU family lipid kinase [Halomonas sp. ANAO-440]|uniref:diacylglycerol/lipid kinase family protein n=1 Tax=Halomonas sp. ANAO-440 TaxID=2861360 RepID=UPI001CAA705D|nr:YegS/Rv2252/BmrU family lipid kinase [Halomonas sp. ANAO-440]MBZ0331168.1 YegS/Rv2252/BmrU family lipid kinase [Halomonas sp. ANAO-440]